MNAVYTFLLTISSALWFLAIWMIWYLFDFPIFSKEDIENVRSCNLADHEFLPVYLGYFSGFYNFLPLGKKIMIDFTFNF